MSKPQKRISADLATAPPGVACAPLPAFQLPPELMREAMIEGFARAFERQMQEPMHSLMEAVQLTTDLRLLKETLFLTEEQIRTLLQISARTFDRYKEEKKLEVDRHAGPGCLRYSLFSVLQARAEGLLEAAPAPSHKRKKGV